jgi:hypothetical protein
MTDRSGSGRREARFWGMAAPRARVRPSADMRVLDRLGSAVLGVLLAVLGLLMAASSRVLPAFRRQVTRDVVVEIATAGGVAQHYVFDAATRRMASRRGPAPDPSVTVRFESAWHAVACLLSTRCVGRIHAALLARRATVTGNIVLLLWFYPLTRLVIPYSRQRPLRAPLPGTLPAPDPSSRVAARTVREPAVAALDPAWAGAAERRATMAIMRGARGERIPMW